MSEWDAAFTRIENLAYQLPETHEVIKWGRPLWAVDGKHFAWIREFSKADVKRFGADGPPAGPILAVRVSDLEEKEAVLQEGRPGFFTIEHFKTYPAVLIALDAANESDVREAIVDAWLVVAPPESARKYLEEHRS